jgi:hypothetical protein
VIAPNIIVLDRIRKDFDGLRIFLKDDPVLPENGMGWARLARRFPIDACTFRMRCGSRRRRATSF